MQGLDGPFGFDLESTGTLVPFGDLAQDIKTELTRDPNTNPKNVDVYFYKISVSRRKNAASKKHDWARINRLFIEIMTRTSEIKILGISPCDRTPANDQQNELFTAKAEAGINLFKFIKGSVQVDGPIASLAVKDRRSVISSYADRRATWIFTPSWSSIEFRLYLYMAVPKKIDNKKRAFNISIEPQTKGLRAMEFATVKYKPVMLPVG